MSIDQMQQYRRRRPSIELQARQSDARPETIFTNQTEDRSATNTHATLAGARSWLASTLRDMRRNDARISASSKIGRDFRIYDVIGQRCQYVLMLSA